MQSTGNINYSFNKNNFYEIIIGCIGYFIPYYYALTIISLIYLFTIKYKQYIFSERNEKYKREEDIIHFFKSITYNSPFSILTLSEDFKNEDFNNNQTISDEITTELNKEIMMDLSKICMRKRDGNPLDKFITITKCQQEDPVYPQKKKLKLKTQEFKEKGINKKDINKKEINKTAINKKKNININYDEEKSETPTFEE